MMLWTRWQPLGPNVINRLQEWHDEMNRLFQRGSVGTFPPMNVWEEGEALVVEAELPGLALEDLDIFVTGHNQLTIKGERKAAAPDKSVQHRLERGFGQFVRTLTMPFPVDENQVEARLENGILTIHLPKHEVAKPRKIAVKG